MPTSAALSLKRGEDGLSIYLHDLLVTRGLGPSNVVSERPGYGVFGMAASDVFADGCTVTHNALLDDKPRAIGFAHALLHPPDKIAWKSVRASLLARAAVMIVPNSGQVG